MARGATHKDTCGRHVHLPMPWTRAPQAQATDPPPPQPLCISTVGPPEGCRGQACLCSSSVGWAPGCQGLCLALGTREQTDISLGKVLNLEHSIHGWKTTVHTEFPHKDQDGVEMIRSLVWPCSAAPASGAGRVCGAAECERWVTTPACCAHSPDRPPPFGWCAGRGPGLWLAFAFFVVTNPANSN